MQIAGLELTPNLLPLKIEEWPLTKPRLQTNK